MEPTRGPGIAIVVLFICLWVMVIAMFWLPW